MIAVQGVADLVLLLRAMASSKRTPPADDTHGPIHFEQVAAGAIAYGFYIAAAMAAGAQFPEFLRDHLFDGFAPAVLVGYLIYRVPNTRARFSTIAFLYLLSAAIFALIAAAAVFSSGEDDFLPAVLAAALIGGLTLIVPVLTGATISGPPETDGDRAELDRLRNENDQLRADWDRVRGQGADAGTDNGAETVSDRAQPPAPGRDAPDPP
jgi:peptidoglycan/LPS O-acetylase OafA/YrhL